MKKYIAATLLSLFLSFSIHADNNDIPKDLMKMNLAPVKIDGQTYLAASFTNHDHWHTYWINPGDAGLPIEAEFVIDGEKKELKVHEWPTPKRFLEQGDILTFGYEGEYTLFYPIPNDTKLEKLEAHFKWLICKHICIPGEKKFSAQYSEGSFVTGNNDFLISPRDLESRFNKLPVLKEIPPYLDLNLVKLTEGLAIIFSINSEVKNLPKESNILSLYPQLPFSFKRELLYKDKKNHLYAKYTVDWDGEYMEPEMPFPVDGIFATPFEFKILFNDPIANESYIIKKTFTSVNIAQADQFDSFFKMLTPVVIESKDKSSTQESSVNNKDESVIQDYTLLSYLLFAFLGGLILNIMPCVLPVISIKLFGLMRHGHESAKSVFRHNIAYTLGVLFTFLCLAAIVALLKSTGEQVGWGFQLQSPAFVAIMVVVIFSMALNLFGLFEFRTPGGNKLGSVVLRDSVQGDFFGGVLATILSTPCSAPFLGTALTFAFTESYATIFIIFLSIGLGLAFPFLLTAFFPRLIKFLPKPGMWMVHFKNILAFTLILTTIWLLDVFLALTDSSLALIQLNTAIALIFFMFFVRAKMTKNIFLSIALILPAGYLTFLAQTNNPSLNTSSSSIINDKNKNSDMKWERWNEVRMNELMNEKQLTFIDFTAKWCITCKVNERIVIDTSDFKELVAQTNMKLLIGDWTKKDPEIGNWLATQGFVGVPAYFVINKDGKLIKLGETITINKIKTALE